MIKLSFFLFAVLSFGFTQAQLSGDVKKLDSALMLLYKTNRFNGTILYAEKGKIVYKKAFGVVDYRTKKPMQTTSAFVLDPLVPIELPSVEEEPFRTECPSLSATESGCKPKTNL